jgi:hypothetical protein
MRRRAFLCGSVAILTAPLVVEAQPGGKVPTVGALSAGPLPIAQRNVGALRAGLQELGYIEQRQHSNSTRRRRNFNGFQKSFKRFSVLA